MRVAANAALFPSSIVTNDEICQRVRRHTTHLKGSALSGAISLVEKYLHEVGANNRRWLTGSEKPIDLIKHAYAIALERAEIDPITINCVIYCGVDRALLEPANAALLASELGLRRARAFDVNHACSGWFTAMQIAGDRADLHGETSLIISAEFPMTHGGVVYPQNFDISDVKQAKWKLATFVLGEAASATLVCPGGKPLISQQRNDNSGYRASYVRLPQTERFVSKSGSAFVASALTFYSDSYALTKHGRDIGFDAFEALCLSKTDRIVVIPHTISSKIVKLLRERYSPNLTFVDIFPEFGNIGTASLAAGLNWYERQVTANKIPPAVRIVGWMLGAGMAAAAFEFPSTGKSD